MTLHSLMRCWLRHDYKAVAAEYFRDADFKIPFTRLLHRCERCGKVKVKEVRGTWRLEELVPRGEGR